MPHVFDDQMDGPALGRRIAGFGTPDLIIGPLPAPRPIRLVGRRPRWRIFAGFLVGAVLLALALQRIAPTIRRPANRPEPGLRGVITRGGPKFPQLDAIPFQLDDEKDRRRASASPGPDAGCAPTLPPGTAVQLLNAGPRGVRLKVKEGRHDGRTGWVARGYAWPEGLPIATTGRRSTRPID